MATKVNVKFNSQSAAKSLAEKFNKVKLNRQMNEEIGEFVVERIKLQARRGKPLNDTGSFPDLKDVSVDIRKALSDVNATHPTFSPARSNITFTGQLINALTFSFNRSEGLIELFVAKTRRNKIRRLVQFGRDPQVVFNQTVDRRLRKRGFKMFTPRGVKMNNSVIKRINNIVKRTLRRALRV